MGPRRGLNSRSQIYGIRMVVGRNCFIAPLVAPCPLAVVVPWRNKAIAPYTRSAKIYRSKQTQLLRRDCRRREQMGRELGARFVEAKSFAGGFETPPDQPGDRPGAGHA